MEVKEVIYSLPEKVSEGGEKIKKGLKYGLATTAVAGMLLGGSFSVNAQQNFDASVRTVERYANRYIDRDKRSKFVSLHQNIKMEEKVGEPGKNPQDLLDSMADRYGNDDGRTSNFERQNFSNALDEMLPKLANLEYGDRDGKTRVSEYEKMVSDLRKNKTFDVTQRYIKEYTGFYDEVELDAREEVRRYLRPEKQEVMYQTFRDVYHDEIEDIKRRAGIPTREEELRKEFLQELFENLYEKLFKSN